MNSRCPWARPSIRMRLLSPARARARRLSFLTRPSSRLDHMRGSYLINLFTMRARRRSRFRSLSQKGHFGSSQVSLQKRSYEIKTPTASLGVRGTVFDVYVANNGETAVLLHHGAVELCNLAGTCRPQDGVGAILFVSENGVISTYSRCGHSFIHTIGLETAFPFIGKTLKVDPVRRMSVRDFECLPADRPPVITHARATSTVATVTTPIYWSGGCRRSDTRPSYFRESFR